MDQGALSYRGPLHWGALLGFLGTRALPGLERVEGRTYARTVRVGRKGVELVATAQPKLRAVDVRVGGDAPTAEVRARVARLLDLGADPRDVRARLGRDPVLARALRAFPGLRVPGAWDPFELAVRAILGQQVSVAAAR